MSNQSEHELGGDLDIAIIGMSGRFPGAQNVDQFWDNLKNSRESITFFTDKELLEAGVSPAHLQDSKFVKAGALLKDIDLFDASFFDFSPRDAEILDPQQRLLLEGAWEALEHSGYDPKSYKGLIGVYAGVGLNTYMLNLLTDPNALQGVDSLQLALANDKDYLATRVSYKLDLKGPSVSVQTACSTSLVAVHMACQSLLNYDTDIAVAGGVSVRVPHRGGYHYQEGNILSKDGHCRAFDEEANGTIFGNGMGVVVVKRLKDALEDGDCIHAVIKATAINNDGSLKIGFTAPSVEGQAKVIEDALQLAGIEKESISYIESHGTGTSLGDPIEIEALTEVYGPQVKNPGSIKIGSVKTNVGHLDTAAGVTGLIKTVMALKNKQIPATLNYKSPNTQINFENSPFVVNDNLSDWKPVNGVRRAGVSSFGMGGTNSHVILEEAPKVNSKTSKRPYQLMVLSAKSKDALEEMSENMSKYLKENPNVNLADAAFTTQIGRRAFKHRRFVIGSDSCQVGNLLETLDVGHVQTGEQKQKALPVAFMFTGQGSQYVNMAKELYQAEPVFQEQVDLCSAYLMQYLGFDIRETLFPTTGLEEATRRLNDTGVTQPALFVIEYALAKLWQEWGIEPEAMIGHSVGEYVAACIAGVFSLEDALKIIAIRGKLMQGLEKGEMLAIGLPEDKVLDLLDGTGLDLAAINGPSLCVVSGPAHKIKAFKNYTDSQGIEASRLHTSHAFHSSMMEPIIDEFKRILETIKLNGPTIPYISNLTGTWITESQALNPDYYAQHLRATVRFNQGVQTLNQAKEYILLEVGPGDTLAKISKQSTERSRLVLSSLRPPNSKVTDYEYILKTVGALWLVGSQLNWKNFNSQEKRIRVPLPTYPFQRERFWIDVRPFDEYVKVEKGKRENVEDWFYLPVWKRTHSLKKANRENESKQFLILDNGDEISRFFAESLKSFGHKVVRVSTGEKFTRIDAQHYVINPEVKEQYYQLIKELSQFNQLPQSILHLWSLTQKDENLPTDIDWSQKYYFNTLMYLAQSIGDQISREEVQINIVTNGLFDILGTENLYPEKALLMGPSKVIHQEYQNVSCRVLDIDHHTSLDMNYYSNSMDNIIDDIIQPTENLVVGYRGPYRWLQSFEQKKMDASKGKLPVKERGTYLITGGLGGLGLLFAEYLARTAKARLVLVSRNGLPPRQTWEELIGNPNTEDELAEKINTVKKLEELGSEVLVIPADITDSESVQMMFNQIQTQFGNLDGVFHAAGVPGGGLLQLKSQENAAQVMAPKVKGTLELSNKLDLKKLDFFVLFSSTLSTTGGLGQVDYTAANAFLDAFAHKCHAREGWPVMAIDWDSWQKDSWQATSFESQSEIQSQVKELRSKYGISDEEGVKAMDIILRNLVPQVVVSTKDFSKTIYKHAFYTELALEKDNINKRKYSRQLNEDSYVAPRNEVEETVVEIWQEVLGIEKIGVKDNFIDLGGHSLLAAQLISRLRDSFEIDLPVQSLFDSPTVEGMSELVFEMILRQVENMTEEEAQLLLQSEDIEA
ncbi:SDR family NAD(P)-dependent oxidoreductase [Cytobacillus pseudoceanisediminis]|uniref:SDR family NAD(P)-dependent oxidoreductase n=1 Tax=Cytobacillus pseudoceanisediminis TaxID=3051614 RepID=A0ABZ2ZMR0_9BACI